MPKHKVKAHFTHKGKQYKPGDDFESDDLHEIQTLAQQGHIEHPQAQQAQQAPAQGQGQGQDPGKQSR
jgi:hypothetical protein